ncbi:Spo0E family sporulation regulatory protein-aspartic acid phosphatase [Metabacillus niabensis]|uniref:Spo0E family sporulation regulatory protein-aspartic acid phosphatase n=1 Tax=Metabacillus TaxID=2675233 RepID=UPI0011408E75
MENTIFENGSINENQLLSKIDFLKGELIEIGLIIGLNHPKTVALSQRLDKLILEYQKHCVVNR